MVNAINSGISTLKNQSLESDLLRNEKKQNTTKTSEEASKVEKLKKSIEGGEYKLDMEKTAKALLEF
jgi:anti-sigma28 factor (negative regulator of flagellin synthesis)